VFLRLPLCCFAVSEMEFEGSGGSKIEVDEADDADDA
jgi:hypothetical protein